MLNSKQISIFVIFCLLLAAVSNIYALDLGKLKVHFLAGEYKQAIEEGEKIFANSEYSADMDELYYFLGLSYIQDGNYLRAWDIFEIIINEFPDSKFKEEAILGLGDTFFLRGDFEKAKISYEKLIAENPKSKLKEEAKRRLKQVESKAYYTVQVGAFSDMANAKKLKRKLIESDYPAYMEEAEIDGIKTYRVRVGRSMKREDIVSLKERLFQEGYPTKIYPQ